jgi:hypothetical protein
MDVSESQESILEDQEGYQGLMMYRIAFYIALKKMRGYF